MTTDNDTRMKRLDYRKPAGAAEPDWLVLVEYVSEGRVAKHGIEILNETGLTHLLQSTGAASDPEVLALLRDTRKFCLKCESADAPAHCNQRTRCRQTVLGLLTLSELPLHDAEGLTGSPVSLPQSSNGALPPSTLPSLPSATAAAFFFRFAIPHSCHKPAPPESRL